ncbi:MAG: hypothetical protein J6V44_11885 [Methanobrevibacter sp.]|nr:hypothetical protein [Methanobrevibacter sp.]
MTIEQIMAEYRDELSSDAISALKKQAQSAVDSPGTIFVRSYTSISPAETGGSTKRMPSAGILGGLEAAPVMP